MRRRCALLSIPLLFAVSAATAYERVPSELSDLPLLILPAQSSSNESFALLLTGDGGWAELARDVSSGIQQAGIPVVVLNSRRYFRNPRSAQDSATDVSRILAYFGQRWPTSRFLLVGYSRGADVLPFVINLLPAEQRSRIDLAVLLNPAMETHFAVHHADSVGSPKDEESAALAPEVERLAGLDVLCVFGVGEEDALCPTLSPSRYALLAVGRGHHFSGDYELLVEAILARTSRANPAP